MDNKKTPKNPKNYIQYILVLYIDLCDKNINVKSQRNKRQRAELLLLFGITPTNLKVN